MSRGISLLKADQQNSKISFFLLVSENANLKLNKCRVKLVKIMSKFGFIGPYI